MSEVRRSSIKIVISDSDEVRYIPDSPELRAFRARFEMGCQILDMRKRSFIFFKRKLKPQEKMMELMRLQSEEHDVE